MEELELTVDMQSQEYPDNFHPLVVLMLERMKTHPEEFRGRGYSNQEVYADDYSTAIEHNPNRWAHAISVIMAHAHKEAIEAINLALNKIQLDVAHEWAMEELINGPERRAKERAAYEAEKQAIWNQQKIYTYAQQAQSAQLGALQSASATYSSGWTGLAEQLNTDVNQTAYDKIKKVLGI